MQFLRNILAHIERFIGVLVFDKFKLSESESICL
jgi:hypothetical protein